MSALDDAEAAGLRYVSDRQPGIRRVRTGPHAFKYLAADGAPVADKRTLERIEELVIPPAWSDVWIAPTAAAHIQATGRDARGQKQYRYHDQWRTVRDQTKFDRLPKFAHALPAIRRRIELDLKSRGLSRRKVLALVIRLLDLTHVRVGNDEYARSNGSFGLTTLRNRHAEVHGASIQLSFQGKSGKAHIANVQDARLARIVARCQELPGHDLFEYLDEAGVPQTIGSGDVNEYLRDAARFECTAKDFRTWAGTVIATRVLRKASSEASEEPRAHRAVAEALGNTVAVTRKYYIDPKVIEASRAGWLNTVAPRSVRGLDADERFTLAVLEHRGARRRTAPRAAA